MQKERKGGHEGGMHREGMAIQSSLYFLARGGKRNQRGEKMGGMQEGGRGVAGVVQGEGKQQERKQGLLRQRGARETGAWTIPRLRREEPCPKTEPPGDGAKSPAERGLLFPPGTPAQRAASGDRALLSQLRWTMSSRGVSGRDAVACDGARCRPSA